MTRLAYSVERIAYRKDKKNLLLSAKRYTLYAIILIFALCGCGRSFHFTEQPSIKMPQQAAAGAPLIAKNELRVGEKLTYEIKWMGIPVGIACLQVKEVTLLRERQCYHIVAAVRSNAFLSKIYKVEDEFHTYIDKERLYTLRFIKKQSEGRYRSNEMVDYDQEAHTAVYRSLLNNSSKDLAITENAQDNFSAIYCFRMQDVAIGKSVLMNVNADEKNWLLQIDVLAKGTMNIYRIGNIEAIEVFPRAKTTEGKPLQKGAMWLWFSADENRIPFAAKAKAAIAGTVTAVLIKVE